MMSKVKCRICGSVFIVDFGVCLSKGWPKCHNQTMELQKVTRGEIAKGVAKAMAPLDAVIKALRNMP